MKKIFYLLLIVQLLISGSVWAQQAFIVKNIEIQGLHRVSTATVESYIPVKRGQVMQSGKSDAVLRALYQTGFYEQVTLSRR